MNTTMNTPWFLVGTNMARRARRLRDEIVIDYAKEGNFLMLINLLRSGEELSPQVRSLVADLLEGKVKRPKRRPHVMTEGDELRRVGRILDLESENWKRTAAVAQVANEFGCSERTVQTALSRLEPLLRESEERRHHVDRISELEGDGWKRTAAVAKVAKEHGCSKGRVQASLSKWEGGHVERVVDLESEGWKRTAAVAKVAQDYGCSESRVQTSLDRWNHKAMEKKERNRLQKSSSRICK